MYSIQGSWPPKFTYVPLRAELDQNKQNMTQKLHVTELTPHICGGNKTALCTYAHVTETYLGRYRHETMAQQPFL